MPSLQFVTIIRRLIGNDAYTAADDLGVAIGGFPALTYALSSSRDVGQYRSATNEFVASRLSGSPAVSSWRRLAYSCYEIGRPGQGKSLIALMVDGYGITADEIYDSLEEHSQLSVDVLVATNPNCGGFLEQQPGRPVTLRLSSSSSAILSLRCAANGRTREMARVAGFRCCARHRPAVQFWLFGSALHVPAPADLDILVLYADRHELTPVKAIVRHFSHRLPPVHLTAMTEDEEREYRFIRRPWGLNAFSFGSQPASVGSAVPTPSHAVRDLSPLGLCRSPELSLDCVECCRDHKEGWWAEKTAGLVQPGGEVPGHRGAGCCRDEADADQDGVGPAKCCGSGEFVE